MTDPRDILTDETLSSLNRNYQSRARLQGSVDAYSWCMTLAVEMAQGTIEAIDPHDSGAWYPVRRGEPVKVVGPEPKYQQEAML